MPNTNFPEGLTNVAVGHPLGQYPAPDPARWHTWFNDFDTYTAGDWTITETDSGATQALTAGGGGLLLLTNTADDDDLLAMQLTVATFRLAAGKRAVFRSRFKVSDATDSDVVIGLQAVDSSPLDVTDGVFFSKADGSAAVTLRVEKDNTASTAAAGSLADDTFTTLAWVFDGIDRFDVYRDDVLVSSVTTSANWPDDVNLTVSFAVQNGEAAAKTMTVDFIHAAVER